jgi:hypothetical protein
LFYDDHEEVAEPKVKGVRGRDRAKVKHEWHDVTRLKEWDDGWYLGYVHDPRDTATLGKLMGHCSGSHWVWTVEERIWYFFALFDPDGIPHSTIHAKQASWLKKEHPRDTAEEMPDEVKTWNVQYPSLEMVKECFVKAGLQYEAGKYRPPRYTSCTYDFQVSEQDYDTDSFNYRYGRARCVDTKPADVDAEAWTAYVKAAKAVEDSYRKNRGIIKLVGRKFKFDGKWLILLSASNKSQQGANGSHGKRIAEWINGIGKES